MKLGKTEFFCSNKCSVVFIKRERPVQFSEKQKKAYGERIKEFAGNRLDSSTRFRFFLKMIKYRESKKGISDIDLIYLKELWEQQNGICPFTGWNLLLPNTTDGWKDGQHPANASLDRIDNKIGYLKGNVRFVSVMANYARNTYTDQELIEFCNAVVDNNLIEIN